MLMPGVAGCAMASRGGSPAMSRKRRGIGERMLPGLGGSSHKMPKHWQQESRESQEPHGAPGMAK